MRKLKAYTVKKVGDFSLAMPRRAKVIAVTGGVDCIMVHTECLHDDDTRAFDTESSRQFVALKDGDAVPDGSQYMGTGRSGPKADAMHVYELPRVKPHGL